MPPIREIGAARPEADERPESFAMPSVPSAQNAQHEMTAERQNLPCLRAGQVVRARGTAWLVHGVRAGTDCHAIDLGSIGARMLRRTLLHPFDRLVPMQTTERPRLVSRRRWTAALRGLLDDCVDWAMPRVAVAARIDVLPYQLQPLLAVLNGRASRLLVADEVGLGKSVEAGLILAELAARGVANRSLVVTPAGLRQQWADELAQRFAIDATIADAGWLARRVQELPADLSPWSLPGCYVTSIDFLKQPEVLAAAGRRAWDILVVDEAHVAASGTDRGAAVRDLAARAQWVVLLSATPHDGNDDRFAALCRTGQAGAQEEPLLVFRRTRGADGIARVRHSTRVLAVRPTSDEAHAYALLTRYAERVWASDGHTGGDAARLAMTVLLKRAYSSMHALERSARRRWQLLGAQPAPPVQPRLPLMGDGPDAGGSSDDDVPDDVLGARGLANLSHERAWLGAIVDAAAVASRRESKLALVARLLARTGEPLLLFTEFRDTLAWVARAVKRLATFELLHGGQTERERAEAIARFASGRARVLLATDAAALGLNLQQRCRLVVNLEVPWNPNRVAQRVGRLARIGQRRRVHALLLLARATGEQHVLDLFEARQHRIGASLAVTPRDAGADALAIGAGILGESTTQDGERSPRPAGHEVARPMPAGVSRANSIFVGEAHLCARAVLARRRLGSNSASVAGLARRRPWVTRLRLRRAEGLAIDSAAATSLVLVRVRLVGVSGRSWASTLIPLALGRAHAAVRADGAAWLAIVDHLRPALASKALAGLDHWIAQTQAPMAAFAREVRRRARAIEAFVATERRRTPQQPGLFVFGGNVEAPGATGDGGAAIDWITDAGAMTVECDVVLGASVRARPPASRRAPVARPAWIERP